MPGLLQMPPERFGKTKYFIAAFAEFIGAGLFAFAGTAILAKATAGTEPNVVWAALGNGFALTVASKGFAGLLRDRLGSFCWFRKQAISDL